MSIFRRYSEIKGAFADGQLLEVLPGSLGKSVKLISDLNSAGGAGKKKT